VSGTRRWAMTAVLFAAALVFLVVAIVSHSAVALFFMWIPLLTVPLVLGRPDQGQPHKGERPGAGSADAA
jgi:hypothetical protein